MTWTKLSDDFADDCWTLSDAAFRLHVEGLCWSNRKLLDLHLPTDDLRRFARNPDAVQELLAGGWWAADGDTYVIRHHAAYQRTRQAVLTQQEVNSANCKRGGHPRKGSTREIVTKPRSAAPETDSPTDSLCPSSTHKDRPGQDGQGQ